MSDTISSMLKNIVNFQNNPAAIQREVFAHLTKVTNGSVNIVDATNPFVFCMESATVLTAGFMQQNADETRKQYSYAAQLPGDLYYHMSDKDYLNRFAIPSKAKAVLFFSEDEIMNKLVLDKATGMKKITIPRNTYFTIGGLDFSIQYPIEIRQLIHGGLQVVYVADKISPLQTLETNKIDWRLRPARDGNWLCFEVDVQQFNIQSLQQSVTPGAPFILNVNVQDQFHYARVYVENSDGTWREIKTTHTDQVYDIAVPTAVLKLIGNTLTVSLPQIYINGGATTVIRADVYQTKGELNVDLNAYIPDTSTITWTSTDDNDLTEFYAPLTTLRAAWVSSESRTQGGRLMMDFVTLRSQVINNATGSPELPITNVLLEAELEENGFTMVTNIDQVTNRALLATRSMPLPTDLNLITAAGASIEMLTVSIEEAVSHATVIDNGERVTITPKTLYQNVKGIMRMVSDAKIAELNSLPPEQRALAITTGNFYYTPFHYVLDNSGLEFESRAYYLDDPTSVTTTFESENDTTLLYVATEGYVLTKNDTIQRGAMGYRLRIKTVSGESFKELEDDQIYVQMAYIPPGEADRAYLNGTFAGKDPDTNERYYDFDLGTTFDIDEEHHLQLNKFKMYLNEPRICPADLTSTFDILYATTAVMQTTWQPKAVDKVLGKFLLPPTIYGISHETITLRFGDSLKALWSQARSVADSLSWKRHVTDKVRVYDKDIYYTDPVTGATISFDSDGKPVLTKLHSAGDPVTMADGSIVYDYRIGDIVRDAFGNPTPENERTMLHQIDLFLIEGVYQFATAESAVAYRKELVDSVVSWIVEGLAPITAKLLEQTRIFYYPKATLGQLEVFTADGYVTMIDAGQTLTVSLAVPSSVKANKDLMTELTRTTVLIISKHLGNETISISSILTDLRAAYSTDVIDVEVSGLGGDKNYKAITVVDKTKRCSLAKRLVALTDDSLIVEDAVTMVPYSLTKK